MYNFDEVNPAKAQGKGKGGLWPWLLGGAGVIGYFWYRTKRKAEAEKARREQELQRQEQEMSQESTGEKTKFSAAERLRDISTKPAHYERGDLYRG